MNSRLWSPRVLLGANAPVVFLCPTCSPDLQRFGLNLVWNEKLSCGKLEDSNNPAGVWVLMDFVGAHDWMVSNGCCGHRRGVNILDAAGSVKWSRPFSTEARNTNAPQSWVHWAKE